MTTLNDILFRVYRNPLLQNVRKVDVVDSVKAVLSLLNIPATFEEKRVQLTIKEFRAVLPKELFKIRAVNPITSAGDVGFRMKPSTDDRILHYNKTKTAPQVQLTYKEVPGWIYVDFKEGEVEVIYTAFQVDESGFPLLPKSESLLLAIENYIKVQYFTILVETGHLSDAILSRAERQCDWYMGQTANSFDTPTEDEAESIFDAIVRLVPDRDAFFTNFKYNSNTEKLVNHG